MADPSTLELLGLLVEQTATACLFVVLTFRPEFTPPWPMQGHTSKLTLNRLPQAQVALIVNHLSGGVTLSTAIMQQIVMKTDGVPLFVEEMTKAVMESGLPEQFAEQSGLSPLQPQLAIPSSLQDFLMARLDRLDTGREVAQLGAVLGREFSYELLQAVSPLDEATLQHGLSQLVDAQLVYQRGSPPEIHYVFKHALIQDAAYQSVLKRRRQDYHQQIAQVLAERFPEISEIHPELTAHHYTEAGLIEQAIPYWQRAGQRAAEHSDDLEAIYHLTKGLELVEQLPASPQQAEQELELQIALGAPLMSTKGWAAPEVEQVYRRAHLLCQQVGETPRLFPVLWGLWGFYTVRAGHPTAQKLAEQCLSLAELTDDQDFLIGAHLALGITFSYLGEFSLTRYHFEQGFKWYRPEQHHSLAAIYGGQDPGVSCLIESAGPLWYLGYPDQALSVIRDGLALARELAHAPSLAAALSNAAWISLFRQEAGAAREQAAAAIMLATEQGFPLWLGLGTFLHGWAVTEQDPTDEGLAQMHRGLEIWRNTGAELGCPAFLGILAEVYKKRGDVDAGLQTLHEAFASLEQTRERTYEAELYRLKGEFTLMHGSNPDLREAEEYFQRAMTIARQQNAKSLELRAVMSLSRFWFHNQQPDAARTILTQSYEWFTEGFETEDLDAARMLLEDFS